MEKENISEQVTKSQGRTHSSRSAQSFDLDVPSLLSVEYPLRVKNTNKAISMIGGNEKLKRCFIEPDMKLELRLRPEDPLSHPIHSSVIKNSNNVLLKFRIPKKILKKNNRDIRKCIEQCEREGISYKVEPFGILKQNYKFRELADFQKITKNSTFNNKFNDSIRSGDYLKIDGYAQELKGKLDEIQRFEDGDLDLPPLVRYAREDISHQYKYYGNLLLDERGEWINKTVKLFNTQIQWGESIPSKHDSQLDIEYEKASNEVEKMKEMEYPDRIIKESSSYHLLECLKIVKILFDMKPIWIRRQIYWLLPKELRSQLKFALPFVAYTFKKGPWRHSFIKFGYDPSKDPKAMMYQIEAFRGVGMAKVNHDEEIEKILETSNNTNTNSNTNNSNSNDVNSDAYVIPPTLYEYIDEFSNPDSEINKLRVGKIPRQLFFDGSNPCNSLSFQIGDIMDDDIKKLIENSPIEETCHKGSGWLNWVTLSRIKSIMKYKLSCIREGTAINNDKVHELMTKTTFTKSISNGLRSDDDDDEEEEEDEEGEGGEDDTQMDVDEDNEKVGKEEDIANDDIIKRLEKLNPKSSSIIHELDSIIKQENVMSDNLARLGAI